MTEAATETRCQGSIQVDGRITNVVNMTTASAIIGCKN